ncbi:MAG TPA: dienelactone hydrolase family protein [Gemmatimonadaceae bacterium]
MIEAQIGLKTPDGAMPTRTYRPDGAGPFPVVIFYMDGVAIRPTLFDMARRLASHGYYVALPDLFYRAGPYEPFDGATVFGDPDARAKLMELIKSVTTSGLAVDTQAIIAHVDRDAAADATRIGTVGYCMGGSAALGAAGRHPDRVRAAASYHGGRLATDAPDSPHLLASKMRARVYVGFAENDNGFQEPQRELLDRTLDAANVPHAIELYHAAHGFTMADLPVYNRDEAERHWTTMLELFGATLRTQTAGPS